jgi:hypothetical protein
VLDGLIRLLHSVLEYSMGKVRVARVLFSGPFSSTN